VDGSAIAFVSRPYFGVISYCLINQAELLSLAASAVGAALDLAFSTAVLVDAYAF
jgi:hypothetical protein